MPAFEIPGFSWTRASGSDFTGSVNRFVNINSSGVAVVPSAGGRVVGVRANKPNSGEACTIISSGVAIVQAGGTITMGANIAATATGAGTVATDGQEVVGVALTAAASGEYFACLLGITSATSVAAVAGQTITIPIDLVSITGAGDVVTGLTLGYPGTIARVDFVVSKPVTTAAKAATLNVEIGTTNVTGGAVALTSANCTPLGAVIAGSAVTAANTFTATDTISVEAASVTAFSEGQGFLVIQVI